MRREMKSGGGRENGKAPEEGLLDKPLIAWISSIIIYYYYFTVSS